MYIHERDDWTDFRWDASQVSLLQELVCRKQGLLFGRLSSLGFDSKLRAIALIWVLSTTCSDECLHTEYSEEEWAEECETND